MTMTHELLDYQIGEKPPFVSKAELRGDVSIEDYHGLGDIKKHGVNAVLSKSQLVEMECPAKFKYKYIDGNRDPDKSAFNVGNAVHTLALEPDLFHDRFYIIPEGLKRDKRTADFKACMAEAGKRKMILAMGTKSESGFDNVQEMAKSLASNKMALALLKRPGLVEPSIFWQDEKTGLKLRCRPDFMADDGLIIDLKTARDVSPDKFFRDSFDNHYDVSVGMTSEGYEHLKGKKPDNYVFLAVEKKGPCIIQAYDSYRPFDPEDMARLTYYDSGRYRFRKYLDLFKACMESGEWPAYSSTVIPMGIPRYKLNELENEDE